MRSARTAHPWILAVTTAVSLALASAACEKPSHENVDKWRRTVQGPGKLLKALRDGGLDPDLRAHAAQALVSIEKTKEVVAAFSGMKPEARALVLAKLAPRLWNDCKLADELQVPTDKQLAAKDALFALRDLAVDPERDVIDGYLIDWLSGYYEGRAPRGHFAGDVIVRALGVKAAPKLISSARAILEDPGTAAMIPMLGDEHLKALAWTCAPDAVAFLLDVAEKDHPDRSLQVRALGALYLVHVLSTDEPRPNSAVLRPAIPRLAAIAAAPIPVPQPGENVNVAFELIAAAGKPHCIAPLAGLAAHKDEARRWRAVQQGLKCAGAEAVVPMAEALPQDLEYPQGILEKYFWDKAVEVGPAVVTPARALLSSSSWVARLTGVEILARAGSASDAPALRALAKDRRRVRGWWKTDEDPDNRSRKADPVLGALAEAAANRLEKK